VALAGDPTQKSAPSRVKIRLGDVVFRWTTLSGGLIVLAIVILSLWQLFAGSKGAIQAQGLQFFYQNIWDSVKNDYGALPLIYGTFVSSIIALCIGGTTGVMVSAFLVELAPKWLLKPISFLVDLLAAIPSIIYGLWGLQVLVPWMKAELYPALGYSLGWTGLFDPSKNQTGQSLMSAGVVLGIMIIPTVAAITREMLMVVPRHMRDGALALGANKSEALKGVMIPYASGGILGGVILGLGRALGETMAVSMLIGNSATINANLLQPSATLSSMIATSFGEADSNFKEVLIGLGLVLFIVTFCINMLARYLVNRMRKKSGLI
jgi:phosphate transport system permease protein